MKNRTKNIIKSFAVLFMIYGCNDSFLERLPLDKISDASFWNTENDLMVYNHSFYDMTKNDILHISNKINYCYSKLKNN